MARKFSPAVLLAGFLVLLGEICLGGDIAQIRVFPESVQLHGPRDRHTLVVLAESAGNWVDVSDRVDYLSESPQTVSVDLLRLTPHSDGEATILVRSGSASARVRVVVDGMAAPANPSFLNEVEPVLTRFGCNQGACHGKMSGQNGFRLSLRGYAPDLDHLWITREHEGRRINRLNMEDSLLLTKPLGLVPHAGGRLLEPGGRAHELLRNWLSAGMPGPEATDPVVQRIWIAPGNLTMRPGDTQQLLTLVEDSDGRVRDVTWLARFDSNDAGMAEVSSSGRVKVLRPGETAIRATFQGQVAVALVTAPYERPVDSERFRVTRLNKIDEAVFAKLEALHIEPSDLCSDGEFVRRVFLDLVGALPGADEVQAFLSDQGVDKRYRLIDELLERPEYVDFWTLQLADIFQNRKERDHDVRAVKGVRSFHAWIRRQVAENRPWDEVARAVLTARGSSADNPAVGYFIVTVGEQREGHKSEVVASAAQAFLGTRIGCAQCHNHPLEKYTQDDYYRFAGYFSRISFKRRQPQEGPTELSVWSTEPEANGRPVGVWQPRTGEFLAPRPLDRTETLVNPGEDPRVVLANWMTRPENQAFAGAMVNRLWKHLMGSGLVEPVDDLRASNPPSNPALWDLLCQDFVASRYNLKSMLRLMTNSRTYQLSSATRPSNINDSRLGSHFVARRLPAEVLLDALSSATGVPEKFAGYPLGLRAVAIPDPGIASPALSMFGRSDRVTACACERSGDIALPQLLHLQNGASVVDKIRSEHGRLAALLQAGATESEIVNALFLSTLSRFPEESERLAVHREFEVAGADRSEVLRDLFWALLNSKEFVFNH